MKLSWLGGGLFYQMRSLPSSAAVTATAAAVIFMASRPILDPRRDETATTLLVHAGLTVIFGLGGLDDDDGEETVTRPTNSPHIWRNSQHA